MAEEIIAEISTTSKFSTSSIQRMLKVRTSDEDQQKRVMKRIKLMLDPTGSSRGQNLPPKDFDKMTEE